MVDNGRNSNPLLAGLLIFIILVLGIIAAIYFFTRTENPLTNQTTENIQVNIQEQQPPGGTTDRTVIREETVREQVTPQETQQEPQQPSGNSGQQTQQNEQNSSQTGQ